MPSTQLDNHVTATSDGSRALFAVSDAIASHRDLPALFHELADRLRQVLPCDYLALILHDAASDTMRLHVLETADLTAVLNAEPFPVSESSAGWVWQTQRPLIASNGDELRRWRCHTARMQALGVQSFCQLPLTTARRRLGTIVFASRQPSAYEVADVDSLQHVASLVAVAVENALGFQELAALNEQIADRARQYVALLAVSEAIASHRELSALFHELAGRLRQVVGFDFLALVLHEAESNTMRMHVLETCEPVPPGTVIVLPVEDDPAGLVWKTQRPLIISTMAELSRWPRLLERVQPYGVQSYCQLPLTTSRRRLGTLSFTSKQPSAYHAADADFLQHVAKQVAVAVENALAFEELAAVKERLAREKAYLEEEIRTEDFKEMVAVSPAVRAVLQKVKTVAPTDAAVLIGGETGTGKELVARALHNLSPRRERTFIKLNCAAIPTGLLESELFGHEKGAFTGAIAQKVGRFELANRGTLFLDEVGDIPLELQPKLLRVLQEQELERLGGTRTIKVDVRLVAATNRDLGQMVKEGRFRSDLYYRLNVFPITMPPLRERREGIPTLVRHFTQHFARRMGRRIETIPSAVMEALVRYRWPGNVRELQNVIERAVILSPGPTLQVPLSDLEPAVAHAQADPVTPASEREQMLGALRDAGWRVGGPRGAAARLGMKRTTLQKRMKKLGVSRPQ